MIKMSNSENGYSLIEILVVLAIIGILATAGVMFRQSPVPAVVKATASTLSGALRNAQTLALSSGQQVYLRTAGGGANLPRVEWGFRVLKEDGTLDHFGPVQGTWTIPIGESRSISIGVGDADLDSSGTTTLPKNVAAIVARVQNNTTIWNQTFFTGETGTPADSACPFFFMSTGAINQEFAVTVTGARSGQVFIGDNRIELVIVSPRSGITTYYNQHPEKTGSQWSRN
jgi:prepilin-type N-terminal cleavage/methylation domain-containing protein